MVKNVEVLGFFSLSTETTSSPIEKPVTVVLWKLLFGVENKAIWLVELKDDRGVTFVFS